MEFVFDINFENELIRDYAKEKYDEFLNHADKRKLEPDYVVNKLISELQNLARRDGFIK